MAITHSSMALNVEVTETSATSRQLLYSANNGVATIEKFTVANDEGAAYDISILIASNQTLSGAVVFQEVVNVGANATEAITNIVGHKVPSGGSIQAISSNATGLHVTISGIERTQS